VPLPPSRCLTITWPGITHVLGSECSVSEGYDPATAGTPPPKNTFVAIWDTGATGSVITERVIAECGLAPIGVTQVHGVHGVQDCEVYLVNLRLPNNVEFPGVHVTKGKLAGGADVLIGMNVITAGDFAVTNKGGNTTMSFRVPSQHRTDYVEQQARQDMAGSQSPGAGRASRKKNKKTFGKNKR
jgi:hypothetical protein